MQSTASTPALPVLPEFRSATSAARALARVESRYSRITRRLDRESRPTCRGEFGGWDWPTLRICQPEVYAELRALIAEAHRCAAWVRFYSFVPAGVMEFAA